MTDVDIRDGECTVPVSRTPVPIDPVSHPVPYAPAPTQAKAALLLDIGCFFDETAFMHDMAAATTAFVDEVDSLEDFAPPEEVHAAIMLVPSTPVPAAMVLVPYAPVLTATRHHSAPAPAVLNALLKHISNVLATSFFPVPEGSSLQHVQTRHLWSPIDRGKSVIMLFPSPGTPAPVLLPPPVPAEVASPPPVPAEVALPPTVPAQVASLLPVPAQVASQPTVPAQVASPPPIPAQISDTAFDHVNAPVCGFSLSLKTAQHSLRMQALLHAPQRAPHGALSVPPHHISPTLALLISIT